MAINFPDNPSVNDEFQAQGRTWIWNGTSWDAVIATIDAGKFIASTNAPESPQQGQGWFDPDTAQFFIYYDSAWIEVGPTLTGPTGATGSPGRFLVAESAPESAVEGDAWFDATSSRTYIYFDGLWVEIIGAIGPTGPTGPAGPGGGVLRSIRTASSDTTLLETDEMIVFNGTDPQILTIPDVLEPGTTVKVIQDNSGSVEFASSGSVNLLSPTGTFESIGQNSVIDILCVAENEYRLSGDMIVISPLVATGGTVVDAGGYRYHTFTSNGTFAISDPGSNPDIEYLVVAGGGGGGNGISSANEGGGGGAGGYIQQSSSSFTAGSWPIVIGAGGSGNNSGNSSTFNSLTAIGGGAGGSGDPGSSGGSGGGGSHSQTSGGAGLQPASASGGFGNNGGTSTSCCSGSGGGGAGTAGNNANISGTNGNGGSGKQWLDGVYYAGGGAGYAPGSTSTGGIGGGANSPRGVGVANTGGGGGGGYGNSDTGGAGGSGIVIIRYPI